MKVNCKLIKCLYAFMALACASESLGQDANSDILNILAEDNSVLQSAEKNKSIYNGQLLPTEINRDGSREYMGDSQDKVILIMRYQTELLKEQGAEALIKMLETYSNELPPTKRDMILLSATQHILRNSRQSDREIGPIPTKSWAPLANVNNPVYRYLSFYAIITARIEELAPGPGLREISLSIDSFDDLDKALMYRIGEERYDMLSQFFDEEDEIFKEPLISDLNEIPLQENLDYLNEQLKLYEELGDTEMVEVVKKSISKVEDFMRNPPPGFAARLQTPESESEEPATEEAEQQIEQVIEKAPKPEPIIEEKSPSTVEQPEVIAETTEPESNNLLLYFLGVIAVIAMLFVLVRKK